MTTLTADAYYWMAFATNGADLSRYRVALKDYGFHDRKKESPVHRISANLFGDGKALDAI